jgi:hypothetical protein
MRPPAWLLGALVVGAAIYAIVEMLGRPGAIPYGAFLDQLDAGNVANVTFQGTEIDGRLKHPVGAAVANGAAPQDIFRSRVPDFGDSALLPELRKQHVAIDVASSSSWTRLLGGLPLPMLLMLGAIAIAGIVRLFRGGKQQSGSAMPMHPMQGMVGLISGLFARQDPVAKPTAGGAGQAPPIA